MGDGFAEPLFDLDISSEQDSNYMANTRKIVAQSELPDNDARREHEENGIDHEDDNAPDQKVNISPNKNARTDSNLVQPLSPALDTETQQKILEQIEFYFSDANVTKDKELAKQIRRNDMGYVSIKWITSFRKIQVLTNDWKAVSKILQQSNQLKVSNDKKMVRRKHPIPKKSDAFADKTVMASNLALRERSVECVKEHFKEFGKVTLVRFLVPGKPYPDDIANLKLKTWTGCPVGDVIAVEFETVEAAERAVLKLSDSNNWRSTANVQLLRSRHQKQAMGTGNSTKTRKSSESQMMAQSFSHSCTIRDSPVHLSRSLPKQVYGELNGEVASSPYHRRNNHNNHNNHTPSLTPSAMSSPHSASRSFSRSFGDSCSPSANSYLGQRLAMEKRGQLNTAVNMVLIREPHGPNGTKGFTYKQ